MSAVIRHSIFDLVFFGLCHSAEEVGLRIGFPLSSSSLKCAGKWWIYWALSRSFGFCYYWNNSVTSIHSLWFVELRLVSMDAGCSERYNYLGLYLVAIASLLIVWLTISSHLVVLSSQWSHSYCSIFYFFEYVLLLDTTGVFGGHIYPARVWISRIKPSFSLKLMGQPQKKHSPKS